MSFKTRNIIILLFFDLVIVGAFIYFNYFHYAKKNAAIQKELTNLENKITLIPDLQRELLSNKEYVFTQKLKLLGLDKYVDSMNTPRETYSYLDLIQNRYGSLEIDIASSKTMQMTNYSSNLYQINGKGTFDKLVKFIWALEYGSEIYRIGKLNTKSEERVNKKTGLTEIQITFDMELKALFANLPDFPNETPNFKRVNFPELRNPFWPGIYRNVPENKEGLLNVETARLQAVVPGKAIIVAENGMTYNLKVGDRVYLGAVKKIDVKNNWVEFSLNKGGIFETFILKLKF